MSDPTNILGKIGKKVGEEFKSFRSTSDSTYATKVSLGTLDGRVSINSSSIASLQQSIVSLGGSSGQSYVTKVSLNNYKRGINVFDDLKATRAEIGDLTVTGTTTTLNTQTVVVEDNIIEVNLKSDGSESAQTGGIQVNRGETAATVTETLGNGIADFSVTKVGDLVVSVHWTADSISDTYSLPNSNPTGSEVSTHLGDLQQGSNYGGATQALNFDFDSKGNLTAIDTVEQTSGGGSTVRRIIGFNHAGGIEDKATILWDDNTGQSMFKFGLGSADADIKVKDVNASGTVAVASGNSLTINNVAIGDYSEFTAGLAQGKA
jgi:hypothetical protein